MSGDKDSTASESRRSQMYETMRLAVWLRVEQLKDRGGPTPEDLKEAQETSDILGERGDVLVAGHGKPGEIADQFNRTARAIAVLAFVPGGIEIFGGHFEANPKGEAHEES